MLRVLQPPGSGWTSLTSSWLPSLAERTGCLVGILLAPHPLTGLEDEMV